MRAKPRKVSCVSGRVLKTCAANWLEFTWTSSFSLLWFEDPTNFKRTCTIPGKSRCLNDCWPVALTSIMLKCFERSVMTQINSYLSNDLDPLQIDSRHDLIGFPLFTGLHRITETQASCDVHRWQFGVQQLSHVNSFKLGELCLWSSPCNWILSLALFSQSPWCVARQLQLHL